MAARAKNDPTPVPYQPGRGLQLRLLQNCSDLDVDLSFRVLILRVLDITMSPVLDVMIRPMSSSQCRAVLKLYDRRFAPNLRRGIGNKHRPHNAEDEALYQSFVRRGAIGPFLEELAEEKRTAFLKPQPWYQLGEQTDPVARYEAALWQECREHFDCETEAYERLSDVQGILVPRKYAHVQLEMEDTELPSDPLEPQMASYFEVRGVLLELIKGYNLWDMSTSLKAPSDSGKWQVIVQSAVNAAHEINKRGIMMNDCGPRNVMVDMVSQIPYIIDLAQCWFKDKIIATMLESRNSSEQSAEDEEDGHNEDNDCFVDVESEYWVRARERNNCAAIGWVMANILNKKTDMKLEINYPNYEELIKAEKLKKKARAS